MGDVITVMSSGHGEKEDDEVNGIKYQVIIVQR